MALELVVRAVKWSWVLRGLGARFSTLYLLLVVASSVFLNNFLPTSVGGDAYRMYRTRLPGMEGKKGGMARAAAAVLIDRVTGLSMLLMLGAASSILLLSESKVARVYLIFCAMGVAGVGIAVWLRHSGLTAGLRKRLIKSDKLQSLYRGLTGLSWRGLAGQFTWALVFQVVSNTMIWLIFKGSGDAFDWHRVALVTASSGLVALLPLSINGLGVLEGSFVAVAVTLGADYEQAVLVAMVRRLMMWAMSLMCGLAYMAEPAQVQVLSQESTP